MRTYIIVTVGYALAAATPACATTQTPELVIIHGAVYYLPVDRMYDNTPPLQALWENPAAKLDLAIQATHCWRGYVGIWEIADDSLYLRAIEAWHYWRMDEKADMKSIFPDRFNNSRVRADWFSGELTVTATRWPNINDGHVTLRFVNGSVQDPEALRHLAVVGNDPSFPTTAVESQASTLKKSQESFQDSRPRAQVPDMFLLDGVMYHLPAEFSERAFPLETLWSDPNDRPHFFSDTEGLVRSDITRGYRAIWEIHENSLHLIAIDAWMNGAKVHLKTLFPRRFRDGRLRADWFSGDLGLITNEYAPALAAAIRQVPPIDTPKVTLHVHNGDLVSVTRHDGTGDVGKSRGLGVRYANDQGIGNNRDVFLFTDFESEAWQEDWSGGLRRTMSVVAEDAERGFVPLQGKALRIKVQEGGHYGASLQYNFKDKVGREPLEIYFRYYLRLGSDWDPAQGGKLPGISGTYDRGGWGGRPSDGRNGWSARGQFKGRKDGKTPIGFYCYHADMKGRYGSEWTWEKEGLGCLENDRWYCIEQYARMNTPGRNDGVLRGWVDGKLAFERTDIRMRDVPDLKIECIWINVYHGGTWTAPSDDHLYIDNVVIARRYIGPMTPPTEHE